MSRKIFSAAMAVVLTLAASAQALAAQREITVRGRLRPTVEAGGWLIVAGEQKYLLLNAEKFRGEAWFREGAEVEAAGETRNVATVYMEGTPFEARTLHPSGGQAAGGAAVGGRQLTRVTVTGESVVQAQPDTAVLSVAVVTQNASASEAQAENASKTDAVVRALKAAAGAGAEVKTVGYSLQPQYAYRPNEDPRITGYLARNSVVVTTGDLTKVGAVIDAAARAGANTIDYLNFTLRRDRPARRQALAEATRDASEKARAVAEALGGRLVRVVEVQEGSLLRPPVPIPVARGEVRTMAAEAAQTPVEVGSLDVRAEVVLVAEIE